jgi:homocysteine S-methyltransferase
MTHNKPLFATLLRRHERILIDGGLATQCEAMGCNIDGALWSAELLQSNPRAIVDAHRAYLDAGAEIIITASYQASRGGLMANGLSAEEADTLIVSSVSLAAQARSEFLADNPTAQRSPLIAASIGPYGAVLNDGSEYTGDYDLSAQQLRDFHQNRLELLDRSEADLLACETLPSFVEAQVLCELLNDATSPAWVSFSCRDDGHISDGTPITVAAQLFHNHPRVLAVGVNCTAPQFIPNLVKTIGVAVPDKAIVAYPNSGETYDAEDKSWSGTVTDMQCELSAQEWIDSGARLIGGCCRMGPAHIAAMAQTIAKTR